MGSFARLYKSAVGLQSVVRLPIILSTFRIKVFKNELTTYLDGTRIILAVTRFDIGGRMIIKVTAFLGVTIIYSVQVWCWLPPALLSFDRHESV